MMIATTMLRWTMVAVGLDLGSGWVEGTSDAESGGVGVARMLWIDWEVGEIEADVWVLSGVVKCLRELLERLSRDIRVRSVLVDAVVLWMEGG